MARRRTWIPALAAALLLATGVVPPAGAETVLFADSLDGSTAARPWRVPPRAPVEAPGGGRALRFERGRTWDPYGQPWVGDESWVSYRVEVDVLPETKWAGIDVHVQDDGLAACGVTLLEIPDDRIAFEMLGLSGVAGAFKLWPVGQRFAPHLKGEWVRLRLDVGPDVVNVYAGADPQAMATFYDLPRGRGGVRLATYAGSAYFRNLRVTALPEGSVRPALADVWAEARRGHVLRDWQVSDWHGAGHGADSVPPQIARGPGSWRRVPADGRGVVDLTGHLGQHNTWGTAYARTSFVAARAGQRTLRLTYTDLFSLWCNGRKVFAGPPRQWFHPDRAKYGNSRLIPDQFEVVVPVRAGRNELLVRSEVTEPFGWGFWVRLVE